MHSSMARMSAVGGAVIKTMKRAKRAYGLGKVGNELKSMVASLSPNFDETKAATALQTSTTAARQDCDVMCSTMCGHALILFPNAAAAISDCFDVHDNSASDEASWFA